MNEPVVTEASRDDDPARGTLAHVRDVSEELVRIAREAASRALGEAPLVAVLRALLPEIERVYAERDRLAEDIHRLRDQATAAAARLRDLEIQLAGHAARSAAEHAAFEVERDRARTLATDLARQGDALALAKTREQQLRADIETLACRAAAEREDALGLAREMVQAAEDARTAATTELETLRTRLASREVAGEDSGRLAAELAAARARIAELEAGTSRLTDELGRIQARLGQAEAERVELARRRDAGESELEAALATDRERLRTLEHALVNAETAAAVATERANMLSAELAALREANAREPGPIAVEAPAPVETVVEPARVELEPMVPDVAPTLAEAEPGAAEPASSAVADAEAAIDAAPEAIAADAALEAVDAGPEPAAVDLADEAPADPEPAAATPVEVAAEPVHAERRFAVLDGGEVWEAPPGVQAVPLPPARDLADRVRELAPDACVVNVAAIGALDAVAALRAAGVATPLWGCALAPNGNAGIALGRFEMLARPVDPARVCGGLSGLVTGGAIVVGSDTTTLMAVRQGLLQAGLSVRTAWNRAQASELVEAVHPSAVVVDLASDSAGAAELLADLARRDAPPLLVLIAGTEQQQNDFAAALAARAFDGTGGGRADLLATAARA